MRITDITIDRFGLWRGLALPLNERGVTVFYGPNEAGKSTLMRFIRGTLYGFNPQGWRISRQGLSTEADGALRLTHQGHEHRIARAADAGQRGRVRVDELDWGPLSEERVRSFLGGTSEALFENVFAIGLQELQELATLDGEEVAQHIYGLSLGPEGEQILNAHNRFHRARAQLISNDHTSGETVELARRISDIDHQLAEVSEASGTYQHLHGERRRLVAEINQAEHRRRNLEDNLRGYRFLNRVHPPWARERKLREERAALPSLGSCPADALARYDTLTGKINDRKCRRNELRQEARRLSREAGKMAGDPLLQQHQCAIRRLADERDAISVREQRLETNLSHAEAIRQQWEVKAAGLDGHDMADRESDIPAQAQEMSRFLASARAYQQALAKKKRAVSRYKQLATGSQKRQAALNERLKLLGEQAPGPAIQTMRRQLGDIDELHRLRLEEARLIGQNQAPVQSAVFGRQPRALIKYRDLPPLFYPAMWFFTFAGVTLFVLGLVGAATERLAAGNTAWIVGGIYACFGLCMAGVTWTVRQHFEQFFEGGLTGDTTFSLTGQRETWPDDVHTDQDLNRVRQSIANLVRCRNLPGLQRAHAEGSEPPGSDLLLKASVRLADLELLRHQQERIQKDRKRLSRYRERLRERQRDVGLRRRRWCEVLREVGLEETLNVEKAIKQWQSLLEASELRLEHAALLKLIEEDRQAIAAYHSELGHLSEMLATSNDGAPSNDSDRLIAHWLESIRGHDGTTDEQTLLRREARQKRKEASRLRSSLRDLTAQRRLLLRQAGASTRDELEQRSRSNSRHQELTRLLEDAQCELQLAAEEEPGLALVEEDLLAFQPDENQRRITSSEIELKQINHDLQTAREELGRVKRELAELANDRRVVSLRFEREQAADELRQGIERWAALELAIDSIDRIRRRIERHAQSETLQRASKYLSQLTLGRYGNIWSPLGERHLCIDDHAEQTLRAEQLSTGTREQLFLAIRLAIIRRFAEQGIELPLVLDDVFVNFDHTRTVAAVETILNVAESGQQVLLFTCHLHLADLFQAKGIDPVWLPSQQDLPEQRRAG